MNDLKIVFSDVDGTLLNEAHKITPDTLCQLKRLHPVRHHLGPQSVRHLPHC